MAKKSWAETTKLNLGGTTVIYLSYCQAEHVCRILETTFKIYSNLRIVCGARGLPCLLPWATSNSASCDWTAVEEALLWLVGASNTSLQEVIGYRRRTLASNCFKLWMYWLFPFQIGDYDYMKNTFVFGRLSLCVNNFNTGFILI